MNESKEQRHLALQGAARVVRIAHQHAHQHALQAIDESGGGRGAWRPFLRWSAVHDLLAARDDVDARAIFWGSPVEVRRLRLELPDEQAEALDELLHAQAVA